MLCKGLVQHGVLVCCYAEELLIYVRRRVVLLRQSEVEICRVKRRHSEATQGNGKAGRRNLSQGRGKDGGGGDLSPQIV